jgi:antitoxin (DNA-binding transcriptional repressor) of toxin-antitoxin stability system
VIGHGRRSEAVPVLTFKTARSNLPKPVARAEASEEIIVARGHKAVAKFVPIPARPKRQFGRLEGKGRIGPEFFDPLPEEELKLWE